MSASLHTVLIPAHSKRLPFFLKQPNVTTLSVLLPFLFLLRCRIVMSTVMAALCHPNEYKYASVCLLKHLLRPCSPERAFSWDLMRFPCSRAVVCREAWKEGVLGRKRTAERVMEMDTRGWGSPSFFVFCFKPTPGPAKATCSNWPLLWRQPSVFTSQTTASQHAFCLFGSVSEPSWVLCSYGFSVKTEEAQLDKTESKIHVYPTRRMRRQKIFYSRSC